VSSRWL